MKALNFKEPSTGVVHLWNGVSGGINAYEFTLCGLAWDTPHVEYGQESMVHTDEPCNCPDCYRIAKTLLPYLKKEFKRIDPDKLTDQFMKLD